MGTGDRVRDRRTGQRDRNRDKVTVTGTAIAFCKFDKQKFQEFTM